MKLPPKIKMFGLSMINQSLDDPYVFQEKIAAEYGSISYKRVFGTYNYYMAHPLYAKHILVGNGDNYLFAHPFFRSLVSPIVGESSLFINTDLKEWERDRCIAKVIFDEEVYFKQYAAEIVQVTERAIQRCDLQFKDGELIHIEEVVDKLVLDIIGNTIFTHLNVKNYNPDAFLQQSRQVLFLLKAKIRSVFDFVWYFSPKRLQLEKLIQQGKKTVRSLVVERIESNKEWDDILSHYLHAYRGSKRENLIDHISNQVASFNAAGYVTTTGLLHWVLVALSLNPTALHEISSELQRVLGGRMPRYEDLGSLVYLSATIKETLRLYPSAHCTVRQAIEDDEINGFFIRKGAGIILAFSEIHRHPDFWENPLGFDPTRFINSRFGQEERFAYIPFGGGKRGCIGSGFVELETVLVLAMLLQHFRFYLPTNSKVAATLTSLSTNRPTNSWMILKKLKVK